MCVFHRELPGDDKLTKEFAALLRKGNEAIADHGTVQKNLTELRKLILLKGLPLEADGREEKGRSLRAQVWKILLQVNELDADGYLKAVEKGPSRDANKIKDDTFRTFKNSHFWDCVNEKQLFRVLNAFINVDPKHRHYVQGMNIWCGTFLYVLPELEAFHCFTKLATELCPLYCDASGRGLRGVYTAVKVLSACLKCVDPELFNHLQEHKTDPLIFAFSPILSLSGHTRPVNELVKIWDYYFAFGVHLVVMCTIAQVELIRDKLLVTSSPYHMLRSLPDLNAFQITQVASQLVQLLPTDLYDVLVQHPRDASVAENSLLF